MNSHTHLFSPITVQDKLKLYPAITRPNPVQDLDATIYAQMRTLHFLKWNKPAPEALLKECGPCTHAFAMGARKAMVLPTHIKVRHIFFLAVISQSLVANTLHFILKTDRSDGCLLLHLLHAMLCIHQCTTVIHHLMQHYNMNYTSL